jgi:hypothetical protein
MVEICGVGGKRNAYEIFIGRSDGNWQLRDILYGNIILKMYFK